MIVHEKFSWLRLLFSFQGTSVSMTWKRIVFVCLVSALVTWWYHFVSPEMLEAGYTLTPLPFSMIGVAVSIFLGFRNNESYDRFWEGRKLWGAMVNVSRSFTRQINTLIHPPTDAKHETENCAEFQRGTVQRMIGYVHALRHHLRASDPFPEIERFFPDSEFSELQLHHNVPNAIVQILARRIQWAAEQGWINEYYRPTLEDSLTEITSIQGGCERIKATPLPYAYTVLIHRIVGAYCLLLPFGIVKEVGVLTPVVTLLISHAFFGLDAIGDEIEEPFGFDDNDLPLHSLTRMIEINLLQMQGELNVPEFATDKGGVLS